MDRFKGYRTIIFNLVSMVVIVAGAMTGSIDNDNTLRLLALVQGVGNLILRIWFTTGPVKPVPPEE